MKNNIHPIHDRLIQRADREQFLGQKAKVLWLTGLSGSGKSTIGVELERELMNRGFFAQVLDGDNVRNGLNSNLSFSMEDRIENIRRIAEIAKLYTHTGIITICTFVSPTREIRALAKEIVGADDFLEVFINTPIEVCEQRDVKGLYAKARRGEIKDFTGIDSPYEAPLQPDIDVLTKNQSIKESTEHLLLAILPLISL
jgi:adenylylsulfate kinase